MANENAAGTGKFLDDLVTRAKGVGGQVREFTEDAFDRVREFSSTAGENLKGFATDAGENLKGLATDAGGNIKEFASGAKEKSQQAFDDLKGRLDGSKKEEGSDDLE